MTAINTINIPMSSGRNTWAVAVVASTVAVPVEDSMVEADVGAISALLQRVSLQHSVLHVSR